jgi:hypothetical protein
LHVGILLDIPAWWKSGLKFFSSSVQSPAMRSHEDDVRRMSKIASLSVSKGESWGFLGAFFWSICHSLCKRLRALTGFNFSESLPFEFCETVSMEQSLQVFVEMILLCVQCMTIVSFWMVPYL